MNIGELKAVYIWILLILIVTTVTYVSMFHIVPLLTKDSFIGFLFHILVTDSVLIFLTILYIEVIVMKKGMKKDDYILNKEENRNGILS